MPNEKNIVKFSLEGIGPFSNRLRFVFDGGDNKSIKLGIYATNGTGKTFISRCFSECSTRGGFTSIKLIGKKVWCYFFLPVDIHDNIFGFYIAKENFHLLLK